MDRQRPDARISDSSSSEDEDFGESIFDPLAAQRTQNTGSLVILLYFLDLSGDSQKKESFLKIFKLKSSRPPLEIIYNWLFWTWCPFFNDYLLKSDKQNKFQMASYQPESVRFHRTGHGEVLDPEDLHTARELGISETATTDMALSMHCPWRFFFYFEQLIVIRICPVYLLL